MTIRENSATGSSRRPRGLWWQDMTERMQEDRRPRRRQQGDDLYYFASRRRSSPFFKNFATLFQLFNSILRLGGHPKVVIPQLVIFISFPQPQSRLPRMIIRESEQQPGGRSWCKQLRRFGNQLGP